MELAIATITSVCSLIGVIVTAVLNSLSNKKTEQKVCESSDLTLYRISELEKKQDKHNTLIERMYHVEDQLNVMNVELKLANKRIKDLEHTDTNVV